MGQSKSYPVPTGSHRYKSTVDGQYYNGVINSPEIAAFGECMRNVVEKLEKEISMGQEEEHKLLVELDNYSVEKLQEWLAVPSNFEKLNNIEDLEAKQKKIFDDKIQRLCLGSG